MDEKVSRGEASGAPIRAFLREGCKAGIFGSEALITLPLTDENGVTHRFALDLGTAHEIGIALAKMAVIGAALIEGVVLPPAGDTPR